VVILTGVTEPAVSIVIPAHNEEAVIAGNLRRLLDGSRPGEFDVIVVANACQDGTARAAATVEGVRVLDTEVPGKPNALRMGDAECATFPRLYLDADASPITDRGDPHSVCRRARLQLVNPSRSTAQVQLRLEFRRDHSDATVQTLWSSETRTLTGKLATETRRSTRRRPSSRMS